MGLALQAHLSLHREVGEEAEVEASAVGDVTQSLLEEFHSGHVVELCRLSDSRPSQVARWFGPPNESYHPPNSQQIAQP